MWNLTTWMNAPLLPAIRVCSALLLVVTSAQPPANAADCTKSDRSTETADASPCHTRLLSMHIHDSDARSSYRVDAGSGLFSLVVRDLPASKVPFSRAYLPFGNGSGSLGTDWTTSLDYLLRATGKNHLTLKTPAGELIRFTTAGSGQVHNSAGRTGGRLIQEQGLWRWEMPKASNTVTSAETLVGKPPIGHELRSGHGKPVPARQSETLDSIWFKGPFPVKLATPAGNIWKIAYRDRRVHALTGNDGTGIVLSYRTDAGITRLGAIRHVDANGNTVRSVSYDYSDARLTRVSSGNRQTRYQTRASDSGITTLRVTETTNLDSQRLLARSDDPAPTASPTNDRSTTGRYQGSSDPVDSASVTQTWSISYHNGPPDLQPDPDLLLNRQLPEVSNLAGLGGPQSTRSLKPDLPVLTISNGINTIRFPNSPGNMNRSASRHLTEDPATTVTKQGSRKPRLRIPDPNRDQPDPTRIFGIVPTGSPAGIQEGLPREVSSDDCDYLEVADAEPDQGPDDTRAMSEHCDQTSVQASRQLLLQATIPGAEFRDIRDTDCGSLFDNHPAYRRGQLIEQALSHHEDFATAQPTNRWFPVVDFINEGIATIVKSHDLRSASLAEPQALLTLLLTEAEDAHTRFIQPLEQHGRVTSSDGGLNTTITADQVRRTTMEIIVKAGTASDAQIRQLQQATITVKLKFGIDIEIVEIP